MHNERLENKVRACAVQGFESGSSSAWANWKLSVRVGISARESSRSVYGGHWFRKQVSDSLCHDFRDIYVPG